MSVRPNVLIGRGEMVETNSGSAIDNFVFCDPLLIYEARRFRVGRKDTQFVTLYYTIFRLSFVSCMRASYQFRIRILIILIALLIVGPPLLSTVYSQSRPQIQVSETTPIAGVSGFSAVNSTHAPSREVTIYSGNVFDSSADWVMENIHHQFYLNRWGVESVTEVQSGARVLLEGYHKFQDNYFESEAIFLGKLSFPVMNYTDIQFSTAVSVLSGSVNVSIRILFKDTEGYEWWEAQSTTVNLVAGASDEIILNPDYTNITSNTSGWIIESAIEITLFTLIPSEVIVGGVTVTA